MTEEVEDSFVVGVYDNAVDDGTSPTSLQFAVPLCAVPDRVNEGLGHL